MRNPIEVKPITIFVVGALFVLLLFSLYNSIINTSIYTNIKTIYKDVLVIDQNDETTYFLMALRTFESNNKEGLKSRRETITPEGKVIKSQYIGAWQVGDAARETTGYGRFNNEEGYKRIMNDSILQLDIITSLLKFNCRVLDYYIKIYDHSNFKGHYVTKSGILAMAHLVGSGAVIKWFDSNGKIVSKDGNNVSMLKYLELNGFNIRL